MNIYKLKILSNNIKNKVRLTFFSKFDLIFYGFLKLLLIYFDGCKSPPSFNFKNRLNGGKYEKNI